MTDYLISGVYKLENTPLEIPPGKCGPFTSGGEKYGKRGKNIFL